MWYCMAEPLAGRIVAVLDAFDAITNHRPYREDRHYEGRLGVCYCTVHRDIVGPVFGNSFQ